MSCGISTEASVLVHPPSRCVDARHGFGEHIARKPRPRASPRPRCESDGRRHARPQRRRARSDPRRADCQVSRASWLGEPSRTWLAPRIERPATSHGCPRGSVTDKINFSWGRPTRDRRGGRAGPRRTCSAGRSFHLATRSPSWMRVRARSDVASGNEVARFALSVVHVPVARGEILGEDLRISRVRVDSATMPSFRDARVPGDCRSYIRAPTATGTRRRPTSMTSCSRSVAPCFGAGGAPGPQTASPERDARTGATPAIATATAAGGGAGSRSAERRRGVTDLGRSLAL